MAAVDVLISSDNFRENKPLKMHITHRIKEDLKGPDGVTGQRPRELDQFRVEKTYSNGNLGLSSATAYQAIHAPEHRGSYSMLFHSLPRHGAQYKQTSARSRLPNLFQRSSSRNLQRQSSHWRNSSVPSATLYASTSQTNNNTLPVRPSTSASRLSAFSSVPYNWTPSHATISATGQALLSESYKNRSFYNPTLANKHNISSGTHLPHHTIVNYVPFYEHRSRGDGASEAESPTKEKPSKKTKTPSPDGTTFQKEVSKALEKNTTEKRAPSALKYSRSNSPDWPGASAKHVSTYGKQEKKRVRFSSAVTDKMEEPPYVETLLHSVSKKLQRGVKEGWAAADESKENKIEIKNERKATPNESNLDEEEDSSNFVSPITRVTVTRRKIQQEEQNTRENLSQQQVKTVPTKPYSQQKILDLATKIISNSVNLQNTAHDSTENANAPSEVQTSRPPTRNATGFVAARPARKGNIMPIYKYVQNKQAIISPSFPDQAPKQRKTFMSYSAKLNRSDGARKQTNIIEPPKITSARAPIVKVNKNSAVSYRQTVPLSGQPQKQPVQYISLDLKINNLAHSPRTSMLPDSPRSSTLLSAHATHFQPIPSMPDHINFCDPGKTEHILEWLNDVNKKRNIESKFKRISSSMSAKTVS